MPLLCSVMHSQSSSAHDEALLLISTLIFLEKKDFSKHMEVIYPSLEIGLRNHQETCVCLKAMEVLGDICRFIGSELTPFSDAIMRILVENFMNDRLDSVIKSGILSTIGDIALALGES